MQRVALLFFGGIFVLLFAGLALAVGINSADPSIPPNAAVVIDGAPPRIGLIGRNELHAEMAREAAVRGVETLPKPGTSEYELLKTEMLYRLIRASWFRSEARRRGVPVTAKQIAERLQPEETKMLRKLGFTQGQVEERQRWQLVEDNVLKLIEEEAKGGPERKQAAVIGGEGELIRDWRARTFCADGFVIELCSNFPAFGREAWVPPACYEAKPETPAEACPAPVVSTSPAVPGSVRVWKPDGDRLMQGPVPEAGGESGS